MEVKSLDRQDPEVAKLVYSDKKGERVTRYGFRNFRHSRSSFLTAKKETAPKTAQRMLRQSKSDPKMAQRIAEAEQGVVYAGTGIPRLT